MAQHTYKSLFNAIPPEKAPFLHSQDHKLHCSFQIQAASCIQVSSDQIQYHQTQQLGGKYPQKLFISSPFVSGRPPLFQSETFLPYGFHQANGLWSFIRILPCLNNRPRQVERRLLKNIQQLWKGTYLCKVGIKSHKTCPINIVQWHIEGKMKAVGWADGKDTLLCWPVSSVHLWQVLSFVC